VKAIGYDSDVSREKVPRLSLERGRKKNAFYFFFPDQFNLFRTTNGLVVGGDPRSRAEHRAGFSTPAQHRAAYNDGFAFNPSLSSAELSCSPSPAPRLQP